MYHAKELVKLRKAITSVVMVFLILASVLLVGSVTAQPSEKVPVIVGFKDKPDADLIRAHGGDTKYVYHIIPAIACSLSQGAIDALERNPKIAHIELDGKVHIIQGETLPWGVDRIDAEVVHSYNKGTAVKVAIIDTGIDYTHPDLDANYKGGYDFVNVDADPKDDNGHGTHCAGIVAAEDNDIGVIGVAPEAYLYAVKVLDSTGSGYLSDVVAGIEWTVDNGMHVVSMSIGTDTDYTTLHDACDAAYAAGAVLVAAAGNDYLRRGRAESDTVDYPARYSSVIAVGATDETNVKASWSSTGSALELAAPGVNIYSTLPTYPVTMSADYGYNYGTASGTSMACPHVTGTVSLIMVSHPEWSNVEVRTQLQNTADDLGDSEWDYWYGYGLVDADEAAYVDTTPPAISGVTASDVTETTAKISWTTDEPSDSVVNYGTTTALGSTASDAMLVISHSVTLTGLAAQTTYYYEVQSTDAAENTSVDNNCGLCYTFTTLAPDTTPPSTIMDLTATAGPYPDINLAWTAATDNVGIGHYNIYRSTLATIDKTTDLVGTAPGTATTYTDSTGTAETTYYYAVCGVDAAGNEADLSNIASATVAPTPSNIMHVASIDMSLKTAGINTNGEAKVTIVDADGVPVEGATVYGHWSDATSDSDSGVTNANGQVVLQSDKVKRATSGTTFTFTVDDVVLSGWTYDASANVETSDSITV